MGLLPEGRRKQGLVMDLSVDRNITLTLRNHFAKAGLINAGQNAPQPRNGANVCRSRPDLPNMPSPHCGELGERTVEEGGTVIVGPPPVLNRPFADEHG